MSDSKFLKHIPCEHCGSSDGNSIYDDNHQYCHVCHTFIKGDGSVQDTKMETIRNSNINQGLNFYDNSNTLSIVERGITSATCLTYGVRQNNDKHYYPYFDVDGSLVAIKSRSVTE